MDCILRFSKNDCEIILQLALSCLHFTSLKLLKSNLLLEIKPPCTIFLTYKDLRDPFTWLWFSLINMFTSFDFAKIHNHMHCFIWQFWWDLCPWFIFLSFLMSEIDLIVPFVEDKFQRWKEMTWFELFLNFLAFTTRSSAVGQTLSFDKVKPLSIDLVWA